MQKSWREDGDKLTFIACLPRNSEGTLGDEKVPVVQGGLDDSDAKMIGDVNLFLSVDDDNDDDDQSQNTGGIKREKVIGEIEIMIATPSSRGKGHGKAILLTFLWYILQNISPILLEYSKTANASLKYLCVKIDAENQTSINLFERIGFTKTSPHPNYFNEVELRLSPSDAALILKDMQEKPSIALYRLPAASTKKEAP